MVGMAMAYISLTRSWAAAGERPLEGGQHAV